MKDYTSGVQLLKALADPGRALIVDMLSCDELCACDLLEHLELTQPTLSHHMKILTESGLVRTRSEGKWVHYSLNPETVARLQDFITLLTTDDDTCVCKAVSPSSCCPVHADPAQAEVQEAVL